MLAETSAGSPAATAKQELYRQFWSEFEPLAKQRGWTNASAPPESWWSLPAGLTGATWTVSFTQFGCRSELYFGHPDAAVNLTRWQVLANRRDDIAARFGDDLIFGDLPNKKSCRIETRLTGLKIGDREQWSAILHWMVDSQERLRSAIAAVGGVPNISAPSEPVDAPGF